MSKNLKRLKYFIKILLSKLANEKVIEFIAKLEPKIVLKKSKNFWKIIKITKETKLKNIEIKYKKKINFGIVVQGPIIREANFTLDNLRSLRENYPEAKIILSTWEYEELNQRVLENLKIEVIKNKLPEKGLENLNYQIFSTKEGIKKLKKYNVEYILKMRTDQRIYNKNIDISLVNLLEIYPIENEKKILQKKRIITTGINTYKFLPFSLSDMLMFGTIEDMERYWDISLSKKNLLDNKIFKEIYEVTNQKTLWSCEMYLYINFIKNTKQLDKIDYSLQGYYKTLKEQVIITDIINLYWFKYKMLDETLSNKPKMREQFLREDEWINLYKNYDQIDIERLQLIEDKIFKEG